MEIKWLREYWVFEECLAGENAGKARNLVIQFQVRLRSDRAAELLGSRLKCASRRVKRVPLITYTNLSTINGLNIVTRIAIYLGPGTA